MKKSKKLLAVGMGINLIWVSACSKKEDYPQLKAKDLDFKNARQQDSIQTSLWKGYLQSKTLFQAWAPPAESPWTPFVKPTLFTSLDEIGSQAKPMYGADEQAAEMSARNFARFNKFDNSTAIFLDLLGPQSVVWGAMLAQQHGFQPVATFNNWPHQKGVIKAERVLGGLIFYAAEMDKLKKDGKLTAKAPPVFMLDYNRLSTSIKPDPKEFDNRYYTVDSDLPSATYLKSFGIKQVLYVAPFNHVDREQDDLNSYFSTLREEGMQFAMVSAQSYVDEKQILTEKEKRDRESRSYAYSSGPHIPWFLFFYGGRSYTPVYRETIFSNKADPTAGGHFVKIAGGGFGGYHGLHSGGGGS